MSDYRLHIGDALTMLRTLPDSSVHMCCSSPPYYALRDYGTATWEGGDPYRGAADCDHVQRRMHMASGSTLRNDGRPKPGMQETDKTQGQAVPYRSVCGKCGARRVDQQIGLEATPTEFIDKLVAVFREVRRVLHPTGQLFVNIGDTRSDSREWLGIPHRLVFALQADGWRWEDEVIWAKPNPMPGSQTNRFTRAHEYVFMLNKSRDAFFDSEAVKEAASAASIARISQPNFANQKGGPKDYRNGINPNRSMRQTLENFAKNPGRTRRTVWDIATEAYEGSHYATMPSKLVEPCVLSGTSAHGCCSKCLAPWQRQVEHTPSTPGRNNNSLAHREQMRQDGDRSGGWVDMQSVTVGWAATCTCNAPVQPCVVLDPFAGSGTTLAVALKFGRRAIGIDLDPRNQRLVEDRIRTTQPLLLSL